MKPSGSGCRWWRRSASAGALAVVFAVQLATTVQPALGDDHSAQAVSLNDYIARLKSLDTLVGDCQKQRNEDACDPAKVGADLHVQWTAGGAENEREIRFGWLRLLLERARTKDKAGANALAVPGAKPETQPPVTVDALLTQARERLSDDEKQAGEAGGVAAPRTNREQERRSLNAILARKEYKSATEVSWKEELLDRLANWLNNLFARVVGNGTRWAWAGLVFRIAWIGALCLGLVWFLIRMERRSRVRLSPDPITSSGAPSAREWQLWLADAEGMAAERRWREAIHFVYWAAISRLESQRLWPADRARTPREYLGLLRKEDPRKVSLTTLTRSFERTWYGGRDAVAGDYQAALQLAAELGVE